MVAGANNSGKITWEVLINCVGLTKIISQVFRVLQHTNPPTHPMLVKDKQASLCSRILSPSILPSSSAHPQPPSCFPDSHLRAHVISHLRLGLKDCGKDNESVGGDEEINLSRENRQ